MTYGIGVDTGGTYTDAVIYEYETGKVVAKSKSPTTREDLSVGIGRALDSLPAGLLRKAAQVSLSTTLATNACVEKKGGRARLVLMGTTQKTLEWIGADKKYGLDYEDVLCLDTKGTYDGKQIDHPDWAQVIAENEEFFRHAEALSVAEVNARRNGAVCETEARDAIRRQFEVPVVMASELVSEVNFIERGATALLNARLLPVIDEFMKAVDRAFEERGIQVGKMIVRSDGSLMMDDLARLRPVETILSGPAASVMGSRALTDSENCLIVDMGGTTTDISLVRGGIPQMSGGINIGGWRTQVKGVYIDTFGLGGDTRIIIRDGQPALDVRRVEPLCAAASKWPGMKEQLKMLLNKTALHSRPLHEFLYLVRQPQDTARYSEAEKKLMEQLKDGPQMIGGEVLDLYSNASERLENEGIVMRCGLTPTDIMHLKGDYQSFDTEAARLAARYFLRSLSMHEDNEESLSCFCNEIYELVEKRLFENIARVLIENTYPQLFRQGMGEQFRAFIEHKWAHRNDEAKDGLFDLPMNVSASLVGIGAPTHIFLPRVADALGAKCIIPEHSEVANAVGAAVAEVQAQVKVEVRPSVVDGFLEGYAVHASGVNELFETKQQAVEEALKAAARIAEEEARRRGAKGEIRVETEIVCRTSHAKSGAEIDLGTIVMARANGPMAQRIQE